MKISWLIVNKKIKRPIYLGFVAADLGPVFDCIVDALWNDTACESEQIKRRWVYPVMEGGVVLLNNCRSPTGLSAEWNQ